MDSPSDNYEEINMTDDIIVNEETLNESTLTPSGETQELENLSSEESTEMDVNSTSDTLITNVEEKTLDVVNIEDAQSKVGDIEVVGDGDLFQLISKASSKSQGWMKSTKVMTVDGVGCVIQVTTQQGDNVAEALTFVPGVKLGRVGGNLCLVKGV